MNKSIYQWFQWTDINLPWCQIAHLFHRLDHHSPSPIQSQGIPQRPARQHMTVRNRLPFGQSQRGTSGKSRRIFLVQNDNPNDRLPFAFFIRIIIVRHRGSVCFPRLFLDGTLRSFSPLRLLAQLRRTGESRESRKKSRGIARQVVTAPRHENVRRLAGQIEKISPQASVI